MKSQTFNLLRKEIALGKFYSPKVTSGPEAIERNEKNRTRTI